MKKILAIIIMITGFVPNLSASAGGDLGEIQAVVQKYFDGTSQGKPDLVREAFLPSLELQFVGGEGELRRRRGADYIDGIKVGEANDRVSRLVSVDFTDNAAIAKAEITSGDRLFTDYLLLLKLKEGWRISNKAFTRGTDVDEKEFTAVNLAVRKYFDGTEQGKPELVAEAFLPSLEIQYVNNDGELGRFTAPDYIARITPGKPYNRKGHVVSVDVTDNAAVVKAEIIMGDRLFTDYLLLLKVNGEWRASNKIATNRKK
tara:strand:+ start:480 stop:1256 length:777 start_codon:yes stop_codon:yes gene_type:complete